MSDVSTSVVTDTQTHVNAQEDDGTCLVCVCVSVSYHAGENIVCFCSLNEVCRGFGLLIHDKTFVMAWKNNIQISIYRSQSQSNRQYTVYGELFKKSEAYT